MAHDATQPELLVLLGPTGIGKTDLSIELAARLDAEIVSADSRKIYRGMDIGTAKPTLSQRMRIVHHLIDIIDPDQEYNVARYQQDARAAIADIQERGKLPMLVGGSGLYLRAVLEELDLPITPPDPNLRRQLHEEAGALGAPVLHERLAQVDPVAAARISPNDLKRIVRALEVFLSTGKPLSSFHRIDPPRPLRYNALTVGLTADRQQMYCWIERRVDRMIALGLVGEVCLLMERGYASSLNSMQGLGYRQMAHHLMGEYDLERAVSLLKRETRRFAKRQMTWFRRAASVVWLSAAQERETMKLADQIQSLWRR